MSCDDLQTRAQRTCACRFMGAPRGIRQLQAGPRMYAGHVLKSLRVHWCSILRVSRKHRRIRVCARESLVENELGYCARETSSDPAVKAGNNLRSFCAYIQRSRFFLNTQMTSSDPSMCAGNVLTFWSTHR